MLTIPYAGHSGYPDDLVLRGALPAVAAATVLDSSHLVPFGKVYRGNAAADGAITWSDVTTAAGNDTAGDVTLFDSIAPTADLLCMELVPGDVVSGISLLISTPAVLTGTPVAEVFYRATGGGWATVSGVATPSLTVAGLVMVEFSLAASAVALSDDELDARNNPQHRCAFLRFTGITGVTTAPAFSRLYKRLSHAQDHAAVDLTTLMAQTASPDFSSRQAALLPVTDDLLAFGFDERPLQLVCTVYRPSAVPAAQTAWVYSTGLSFVALPTVTDPSGRLTAPLPAGAAVSFVPGSWNGSDSGADTTPKALAPSVPAGQVLEPAVLGRIAISGVTLFGAFLVDPNMAATAVEYAGSDPALRGSNLRTWYLWAQDGTLVKLVRLRFQLSATGGLQYLADAWFKTVTGSGVAFTQENIGAAGTTWTNGPYAETNAVAGYGIDGITGTIQPSIVTTHRISFAPPANMAKTALMGAGGTSHTRYWVGVRQVANSAAPVSPENMTVRALVAKASGAAGVPSDATAYANIAIVRHPVPAQPATLVVANVATGQVAAVTLLAGQVTARASVSLSGGAIGDGIALLHTSGPEMDDAVVYLW